MKNPIIIIAIIFVLGAVALLVLSVRGQNQETERPAVLPTSEEFERPVAAPGKRMVYSPTGFVEIRDVTESPEAVYSGDVYVVTETSQYSILYYEHNDFFLVSLLDGGDFAAARTMAEQAFLDTLEVSEAEACELSVDLVVPPYIDFDRAGSYGLSYCVN